MKLDRQLAWRWGLILAIAIGGLFPFLEKGTSELPVYTTGGARMAAGDEIYRPDDHKPFSYPPFFALPFAPFTALPDAAHRPVWYVLNVGLLIWVVLLIRRVLAGWRGEPPSPWFWVAVWVLAGRHVLSAFENQSHDLVILWLLALVAVSWGRGRGWSAGFLAGVGGACKATPLLFGLPFAVQRRWLPLVGLGVGFLAASLLPDLVFPRDDGKLWLVAWYEIMLSGVGVGESAARAGVWTPANTLNQALSGTIYRLTTVVEESHFIVNVAIVELSPGVRRVATILGQLGVVGLVAWTAWRRDVGARERPFVRLGQVGAVGCGMVLLSPMSSKSHFCVLLLPVAFCVADSCYRRRDRTVMVLLALVFLLGTLTSKGLVGSELGKLLLGYGCVTWTALCCLIATGRVLSLVPPAGSVGDGTDQPT